MGGFLHSVSHNSSVPCQLLPEAVELQAALRTEVIA